LIDVQKIELLDASTGAPEIEAMSTENILSIETSKKMRYLDSAE
jgi:hypothetical protein